MHKWGTAGRYPEKLLSWVISFLICYLSVYQGVMLPKQLLFELNETDIEECGSKMTALDATNSALLARVHRTFK